MAVLLLLFYNTIDEINHILKHRRNGLCLQTAIHKKACRARRFDGNLGIVRG